MHHYRVTTAAGSEGKTHRLHLGTIRPTHQDRASLIGTDPDHVNNSNHHTNA
ncbi:MAG: hypothetical protein KF712_03255 [Akkermansiaceae bacterium]|nr:hypothetical protein [Akkermansiaceae bacterium]